MSDLLLWLWRLSATGYLASDDMRRIVTFGAYESNGREAILKYWSFHPEGTGWTLSHETGIGYVL
jgi:hypothetical protein